MLDLHRRSSHPHLCRGRLYDRLAIGEDAHAGLYREAIKRIVSGCDALPDEPLAVALGACLAQASFDSRVRWAGSPTELRRLFSRPGVCCGSSRIPTALYVVSIGISRPW